MTIPLAVQLYTLRHLSDEVRDLIKVAADAGYAGVEGGYGSDLNAADLKAVLDDHGLKMASSHVTVDALERDLEGAVAFQKTLHNEVIVIPWIDSEERGDSAESWQALGEQFERIAQQVNAEGLTLLYHNHSFEFGTYEGKLGLEHLLDSAPNLGLELDIGWCQEGGVDPFKLLDAYAGRVRCLHVKDRAPEGENTDQGGWADVGHGVIDWEPLLSAAENAGAQWFIVEHDEPKDPVRSVRRSFDYLSKLSK